MSQSVYDCTLLNRPDNFSSIEGRFSCISINAYGKIILIGDKTNYTLGVDQRHIVKLVEIATRDKGSLYVKIEPSGVGYVMDMKLREEA